MRRARIVSTGSYLPSRVVTNADLVALGVDTTPAWIEEKTGIRERRYAAPGESSSDLGAKAAEAAIKASGLDRGKIQAIVLATSSPDQPMPSTAAIIQKKLGLHAIPSFDLHSVCSGFNYALATSASFIESGLFDNVLVIGAETYSRIINFKDRRSCVFFGDGAGALVLQATDDQSLGVQGSILGTDGDNYDAIQIRVGGVTLPPTPENLATGGQYFAMDGHKVFDFATKVIPRALAQIQERCKFKPEDISLVVPHQANINILKLGMQKAGYPMDKAFSNLDRFGNTAGASIFIALDEAASKGLVKKGDRVLTVGFGGGLSWGANLIHWG